MAFFNKRKYDKPSYRKVPYAKLSEFRYNNSRDGGNHPNYVFGWTPDDRYLSIGITTSPPKKGRNTKFKYEQLSQKVNPNLRNSTKTKPDYICVNSVHHNKTDCYGNVKSNWSFSNKDKKLVDSVIENHKKTLKK